MTTHDAPETLLAEYASGTATPGLSLLVATHLTYAPDARARVAALEDLGGALMSDGPDEPVSGDVLTRTLSAIDALPAANGHDHANGHDIGAEDGEALPAPVRAVLNGQTPKWRFRLPGVSEAMLDGFEGEQVSLLRARPGASIPQHTHEGREYTLVMQGALADGDRIYRAGDVATCDEHDDHRPRIIGDETCICLIVMEGGLRFTGRFSRALNLLGE